ncbi:MAG: hypothetical protein QXU95_03415 [Candidatus Bathyarchaeia archaeon]|nr:hypothetical protein [Candidatus Bathyarchaeota archaeon]
MNKDECNPIKNLLKFLFGVIFDQGIPWKRAWKAPTGLEKRLKHLDIKRISNMETSKNIVAALVENFNRRWKQATEL